MYPNFVGPSPSPPKAYYPPCQTPEDECCNCCGVQFRSLSEASNSLSTGCLCWQPPWGNNQCGHWTSNSWTPTMCPTLGFNYFPVKVALSALHWSEGWFQGPVSAPLHQAHFAVHSPLQGRHSGGIWLKKRLEPLGRRKPNNHKRIF